MGYSHSRRMPFIQTVPITAMTSINFTVKISTEKRAKHQTGLAAAGRMLSTVFLVTVMIANANVFAQTTTTFTPAPNVEERQQGIDLFRQGKFAEATKLLKKFLKKNRSDYDAWYFLGLTLLRQPKEIKEASKALETALKLRPNSAAAHVALSYSLLLRNKLPDANREAQEALSLDRDIVEAHYVIGVIRLRADAREEALERAETTIKLNPQFAPGYLLKSQALVSFAGDALVFGEKEETKEARKVRYSESAEALEKYLQLEPNAADKQTWTEQLESLRFYVVSRKTDKSSDGPFSNKEVTTKVRVLSKPEPSYTEDARRAQIVGTVVLRAIFTSDGIPKHFLVVKALPHGLTQAALKAAQKIRFVPATIDGRPVSVFIQLEYNFNLY